MNFLFKVLPQNPNWNQVSSLIRPLQNLGKCETSICVLFGRQWFAPYNSPMDASFCPVAFLLWGKWDLQFFPCLSGFFCDLLDELSERSWVNFGLFTFVDNGWHHGLLKPQSLSIGFVTVFRLKDLNFFVLHTLLNVFGLWHHVLLSFQSPSCCQTGSSLVLFRLNSSASNQASVWYWTQI